MVSKQILTREFKSHWISHSYGLVRHESKKLKKLQEVANRGTLGGVMLSKLDYQTFTKKFEFHWVLRSYDLVPHLNLENYKIGKRSRERE